MGGIIKKFNDISPDFDASSFIAETAVLIGQIKIGKNSSIWYNSVLRGDIDKIIIGDNTNIQDGSIVHVDFGVPCIIGSNVTVGHACILHACNIEDDVRIGMGAIVLNGSTIKKGAQVGAGALVPPGKVVGEGELFMGVPAKKVRDNSEVDLKNIKENALSYVELSKKYL